jgi:hypothetical protein
MGRKRQDRRYSLVLQGRRDAYRGNHARQYVHLPQQREPIGREEIRHPEVAQRVSILERLRAGTDNEH